jgi:hypothetical protein
MPSNGAFQDSPFVPFWDVRPEISINGFGTGIRIRKVGTEIESEWPYVSQFAYKFCQLPDVKRGADRIDLVDPQRTPKVGYANARHDL